MKRKQKTRKLAGADYNYQTRALEFNVGDTVSLILGSETDVGRVIEVYPAIGQVQVQWPHTTYRHPVEDLLVVNPGDSMYKAPTYQTVPGGAGTASVSLGPGPDDTEIQNIKPLVENVRIVDENLIGKVAKAFVKKSLYWHGRNRQYRCKRTELDSGRYLCPKSSCKSLPSILRNAVYKREDGKSVRLLACPNCLFLIRRRDVMDGSSCEEDPIQDELVDIMKSAAQKKISEPVLKWMVARTKKKKGAFVPELVKAAFEHLEGWEVEDTVTFVPVNGYGGSSILDSLFGSLKSHGVFVATPSIKDPVILRSHDRDSLESFLKKLEANAEKVTSSSAKMPNKKAVVRKMYMTSPSSIKNEYGSLHEVTIDKMWAGISGWKVSAPNNKIKVFPKAVSRRNFEEAGPAYKVPSFWTFVYKNGLDQSCKDFIEQSQEDLELLSKPKAEREKMMALREFSPEVKKVLTQITDAKYRTVISYWEDYFQEGILEYRQDQERANDEGKILQPFMWRRRQSTEDMRRKVVSEIFTGRDGLTFIVEKNPKTIIDFWAKRIADEGRQSFLQKNTIKLSAIVNKKGNFAGAKIQKLNTEDEDYGGEILFTFDDDSEFTVRNKTVWKVSKNGLWFAQFPTTFHNVKLPNGKKMKQPSEKRMVEVFATA